MKPKIVIVFFCLLFPALIFAIKTPQVEFGANGSYDGLVKIFRDDAGRLIFMDESLTSPIALNQIGAGNRAHGSLSGLGNDDHRQYLNGSRHGAVHARSFNDHLPAGPDAAGNTTQTSYERADQGVWMRRLTRTLPAGNGYTYTYWGDSETSSQCQSAASNQAGRPKRATNPDPDGAGGQACAGASGDHCDGLVYGDLSAHLTSQKLHTLGSHFLARDLRPGLHFRKDALDVRRG